MCPNFEDDGQQFKGQLSTAAWNEMLGEALNIIIFLQALRKHIHMGIPGRDMLRFQETDHINMIGRWQIYAFDGLNALILLFGFDAEGKF